LKNVVSCTASTTWWLFIYLLPTSLFASTDLDFVHQRLCRLWRDAWILGNQMYGHAMQNRFRLPRIKRPDGSRRVARAIELAVLCIRQLSAGVPD
jgi:hypothetical protein